MYLEKNFRKELCTSAQRSFAQAESKIEKDMSRLLQRR
uniref:Uncharacterized protein n=1 Tax=Triticum urartu TaxID=4572 RepID=A0A8R7R575_TRIUA